MHLTNARAAEFASTVPCISSAFINVISYAISEGPLCSTHYECVFLGVNCLTILLSLIVLVLLIIGSIIDDITLPDAQLAHSESTLDETTPTQKSPSLNEQQGLLFQKQPTWANIVVKIMNGIVVFCLVILIVLNGGSAFLSSLSVKDN